MKLLICNYSVAIGLSIFRLLVVTGITSVLIGKGVGAEKVPVNLELVLAIDTSLSVDDQEFELQRQGLANAFLHRDVVNAILAHSQGGIAVAIIHWAGENKQQTAVDWMLIKTQLDAIRLSARIRAATRKVIGQTDIGGAILYSAALLNANDYEGARRVIDVSGDGSGEAASTALARDHALAQNITINGLVIYNEDFAIAIRRKLVREIFGPNIASLEVE